MIEDAVEEAEEKAVEDAVEKAVDDVVEEVVLDEDYDGEAVNEETPADESSNLREFAFGDDKEIDERVVKRVGELLIPYLIKDSLTTLYISYNEYVYLEESLFVRLSLEKLLEIVGELVKKHAVNKWTSNFNGLVYVFKKRSKLLRFKKNKKMSVNNSIIEYHLEKDDHVDTNKMLIGIEEEFKRAPEVAK